MVLGASEVLDKKKKEKKKKKNNTATPESIIADEQAFINKTPTISDKSKPPTQSKPETFNEMGAEFISRSIPVFIDSMRKHHKFRMARCNYLSIEADTPMPGWHLLLGEKVELPFLMMGLSGIIYQPINSPGLFDDPEKIHALYKTIEETPGFFVDTNDIWIPDSLFEQCIQLDRYEDHIFRISFSLFKSAWLHRNEQISAREFESICSGHSDRDVYYSSIETKVFKTWWDKLIEETRKRYKASPNRLNLRKKQ